MAGDPLSPQMPIALLLPSAMAGDVLSPIGQLDGGAEPQLPNLGRLRAVAQVLAMRGFAAAAERGRPSCELSPIGALDGGADGAW
eukprot:CAMPEP_0180112338 /NCGR_PEP_ID=MMETSP0985-20121206/36158_1 /TAXON_ID=483367 /ORGANISM="non described non described, Strain CCMP 2436" /LENGTH=84 /DNA_ID=CAMNT_0022050693 /DNA_START=161 /DNA_END=412 /DNA_ORIENTATION=+